MKFLFAVSTALAFGLSAPAAAGQARVILVGDSTMASNSGYGDALCARFAPAVECINRARGGRSSSSYRAELLWDQVRKDLAGSAGGPTYVLIQFGHNDQPGKPGRSTDLVTQFPANMANYVRDVRALGGQPVLLTPLTRRQFRGVYLANDLAPWAAATRAVAQAEHCVLLDLNADSQAAVQAMGEELANTLAAGPKMNQAVSTVAAEPQGAPKPLFDRTHLGPKGAQLFSAMVADELRHAIPALAPYLP